MSFLPWFVILICIILSLSGCIKAVEKKSIPFPENNSAVERQEPYEHDTINDTDALTDAAVLNNRDAWTDADALNNRDTWTDADVWTDTDVLDEADSWTDADALNKRDAWTDADLWTDTDVLNEADAWTNADALNDADAWNETDALTGAGILTDADILNDPDIPKEYHDLLRGAKADDWRIPQIFLAFAGRHEAEGEEGRALHFLDRAEKAFAVKKNFSGEALVFSKKVLYLMHTGRESEAQYPAAGGGRKMGRAASSRLSGISRRPSRPAAGRIRSSPGATQPVYSG